MKRKRYKQRLLRFYGALILSALVVTAIILALPRISGAISDFEQIMRGERKVTSLASKQMEIPLSSIQDTGELSLVNATYGSQESAIERLSTSDNGVDMLPVTLKAAEALIRAAQDAVGGSIVINSGFRSHADQEQLYENEEDKSLVQLPGHSEHETGLAVDLAVEEVEDPEASPQSQYLIKHAWKYGLIHRYPADKSGITKISGEFWHFRYVGKIHAWYMMKHHLCLEQYISFLKQTGGYSKSLEGKFYTVSYQTGESGIINVPKDGSYTVSGDNTGGWIITSWR